MKSLSIYLYTITYMYCILIDTTHYRYIILICMSLLSRNIRYTMLVLVLILIIYNLIKDFKIDFVGTRFSLQGSINGVLLTKYASFYEAWEDLCVTVYYSVRKVF